MRSFLSSCLIASVCLLPLSSPRALAAETPDRFAFVVGNFGYERRSDGKHFEGSLINLRTPERDALQYVDILENKLGWTMVNSSHVDRTAAGLLNDLSAAARTITAGSEVLFVFNGHGFSRGNSNYLVGVPENGELYTNVEDMIVGSINLGEVIERLAESSPSRIIMVINACGDEPLVADAETAPVRGDFDNAVSEVLVLYSSSPKGIAYDVRDNFERGEEGILSVFTRAFLPLMGENRPLLSIFADARIEVERLSRHAAAARNLPERQGLQIPHVLFDTINGQFNLADVAATRADAASLADWRRDPQACRFKRENLEEALLLRETGAEKQVVRACILAAALGDLGIERMSFDSTLGGIIVSQASVDRHLVQGDLVTRAIVNDPQRNRTTIRITSMDVFQDMLADYYYKKGWLMTLRRVRKVGNDTKSGHENIPF